MMQGFTSWKSAVGEWRMWSKSIAFMTLTAFLILSLVSCVNTRVLRVGQIQPPNPSVELSIYNKMKDFRAGGPTVNSVMSELYYHKDGHWQLVRRESTGIWRMTDLVAGKYKIEIPYRTLADGEKEDLSGDTSQTFTIKEGEDAQIRIILEKTPVVLIVCLAVTVVFLLVLIAIAASNGDVDLPSLPTPPDLFLNPLLPPLLPHPDGLALALDVMVPPYGGFYYDGDEWSSDSDEYDTTGLRLMNHSPKHNSINISPETNIQLQFNAEIDSSTLDHRNIIVTDSQNNRINGGIYFLDKEKTCVYDPLHLLPKGETITVTVMGDSIKEEDGAALSSNYRWSFTVQD